MAPWQLSFPSVNSSLFHPGFLGDAGRWLVTAGWGGGRRDGGPGGMESVASEPSLERKAELGLGTARLTHSRPGARVMKS